MFRINKLFILVLLLLTTPAIASVVTEYATNTYTKKSPSRSEKKCMDEGYTSTYETCPKMTAPTDPCPFHNSYYKSCSQEQWCKNNNYSFKPEDCQLPSYPIKMCDNKTQIYRACRQNIKKACEDKGFSHMDNCKLTPQKCPYSDDYGICCTTCEGFSHDIKNIPAGYIADGPTCINCDDITKTNIIENPCEGFITCDYGPENTETASCQKGSQILYQACKTAEMLCEEKGYTQTSCSITEDSELCPEYNNLMKCSLNCIKLASLMFPDADIIDSDITDPKLDITKTILKSTYGKISDSCISNKRPEITLNIDSNSMDMYGNILNRTISDVTLVLNFIEPIELDINGEFNDVRIKVTGNQAECALKGRNINVSGTLNISGANNVCANITVAEYGKFITSGNIKGNIDLQKYASLGVKGNVFGYLKAGTQSETLIKGILKYKDSANNSPDTESIHFGCGTKTKISGGIIAETANVVIRQRAIVDTAYIKLVSTSDNPDLPNTLSSLHIQKNAKIYSTYDRSEFLLAENNDDINCDDKYIRHLGSSIDESKQSISLEPSELLTDKWQCRKLDRRQLECL